MRLTGNCLDPCLPLSLLLTATFNYQTVYGGDYMLYCLTGHWSADGDRLAQLHRPAPVFSQAHTVAGPHALHSPWKTPPVPLAAPVLPHHWMSHALLQLFSSLVPRSSVTSDCSHKWRQQLLIRSSVRPKGGVENANTSLEVCRQLAMPSCQSVWTFEKCSIHKVLIYHIISMEEQTSLRILLLCHQKGN